MTNKLISVQLMALQALSNPVLSAVGERYYKVTAEALRVCGELVRVIRPSIQVGMVFALMYLNIFVKCCLSI